MSRTVGYVLLVVLLVALAGLGVFASGIADGVLSGLFGPSEEQLALQNKRRRRANVANGFKSALGGALGGAATGVVAGGPIGAAIGGGVGLVLGLVGGLSGGSNG